MGFNLGDIEGLDKLQDGLKQAVQTGVNELNKGLEKLNNPEEAKSNVPETCPYCGAKLPQDSELETIKCAYCGAEFDNSQAKTIVDSVFDFVEKQQQIAKEQKDKELELAKIKAQEKAAKRAARKKHAFVRNFIFLVIILLAFLYYYFNYMQF